MRARIGHLLVRDDLITETQLSRALEVQNFAGGRIGTLLMERAALGEDELGRALALQHGCGYIPWSSLCNIPAATIAALPARFALKHCAIPYEHGEGYVRLALRDPSDLRILDELVFVTGGRVLVDAAPEVRIYQALEKYYGKLREPRYAILAERLSRPQKPTRRSMPPPPPPNFFSGAPAPGTVKEAGTGPTAERRLAPAAAPTPPSLKVDPLPEAGPPAWAAFFGEPELVPDGIAWEDTTGGRSRPRTEADEPPPPAPFPETVSFDFGHDAIATEAGEFDFSRVGEATERDAIADAVLASMAGRFRRAAIFSSRSEGITGWAAVGERIEPAAIRGITISWTEPSVFLNTRLSRTFHLGPLPDLPRHDEIADALGGRPDECVVEPVFIGEKPIAFLLAAEGLRGPASAGDLAYLHALALAASSAFENAIRLKKKEI
jgi:hypothetical protein